jgi:hypothetical protein
VETIKTVRDLMKVLRNSGSYTSLGCYPLFYVAADGESLHPKCVLENIWSVARAVRDSQRKGFAPDRNWQVVGIEINWEDPDMQCAHCNERIESAYAEDEAPRLNTP